MEVAHELWNRPEKPSHTAIVVMLCAMWSCTQFAWAVQNGNVTPKLRALGVADEDIAAIWIAGPISGLISQPLVGYLSDTFLEGRRKPVAYAAIAAICISLVAFGTVTDITATIICFWCLDVSINCLMDPTRALLANLLPDVAMQTRANFSFVFAGGLARTLGFLSGSYNASGDSASRMLGVFLAAAIYVAVVGLISVTWLPEAAVHEQTSTHNPAFEAMAGLSLIAQSKVLRLAFLAQLLSYMAWSPTFIYGAEWLATHAFDGGDPASSGFVWALSWANLTLAGMSLISAALALALPGLPLAPLWTVGLLALATCLAAAAAATLAGVHAVWLCVPILLLGFAWVCSEAIPWRLVSEEIAFNPAFDGYGGRVVAAFNVSQCIPGILGAFTYGPLQRITHSLAPLLLMGAVTAGLGAGLAWFTGREVGEAGYQSVEGEGHVGGERKDGKMP